MQQTCRLLYAVSSSGLNSQNFVYLHIIKILTNSCETVKCPNVWNYNAELTRCFTVMLMLTNKAAFCHKWHYQDKSRANVHELFSVNTRNRYTCSQVLEILVLSPVRPHHKSIWLQSFITEINLVQLHCFTWFSTLVEHIVSIVFVDWGYKAIIFPW